VALSLEDDNSLHLIQFNSLSLSLSLIITYKYNLNLKPAEKAILETTKKTNVILYAIPKKFDSERLNFETRRLVNNKGFEKNYKIFMMNFKTETMNRNNFTKNGLHLNNLAKNTLNA